MDQQKKHRMIGGETISHIGTGIAVTLKGVDKMEHPEKLWVGLIFIGIGLIIFFIGLFHHQIEQKFKKVKTLVFFFESVVMAVVGYLYLKDHKVYLQYVCFIASIVFFIVAIRSLLPKKKRASQ